MEEFRVCTNCGYKRGFHVAFQKMKGKFKMVLICPNCGQSYDVGWTTSTVKTLKEKKGPLY